METSKQSVERAFVKRTLAFLLPGREQTRSAAPLLVKRITNKNRRRKRSQVTNPLPKFPSRTTMRWQIGAQEKERYES